MRWAFIALAVLAAVSPAIGQQGSGSVDLPPLVNEAPAENCVEVEIGNAKTYDCLNSKLKELSTSVPAVPNLPPFDARSRDTSIGIVNVPAVRQQYGPNFGKSVVPYRPTPPSNTPRGP